MTTFSKIFLTTIVILLCVFALNWAIANAYSGVGFYTFALANGLIFCAIIVLAWKAYRKNK